MAAILFVESNFVLELVLQQPQYPACQQLLALARAEQVELRLPVFSLMEPVFKLKGDRKERKDLNRRLTTELGQYAREAVGENDVSVIMSALNTLLITRSEEHQSRLGTVVSDLLEAGTQLLPLDAPVWQELPAVLQETDLELGDALVYASIRHNLRVAPRRELAVFVTRDNDFKERTIRDQLRQAGCELMFDFGDASARLRASR